MALLDVMARLGAKLGFETFAHGVDHGLRDEATRELDQAEAFATARGVVFERTRVSVARGGNLQARAREARFRALRAAAAEVGAARIATAHHADDRAETVLLRVLRGASPAGLAVLPPAEGDLVRPFVRARRQAILAHLARHDVPYAADPSNLDPRFLRARVRHELLPLLAALSPGIVDHLNGLADDLTGAVPAGAAGEGRTYSDPIAATLAALPRPTRQALAALVTTRSTTARVALGHGLVASFVPPRDK
jgi:tRNA(Ile)-lysidine synthase